MTAYGVQDVDLPNMKTLEGYPNWDDLPDDTASVQ